MPDVMGQRQNDDNSVRRADPTAALPDYTPAVIVAGVLAFAMAALTVLMVRGG